MSGKTEVISKEYVEGILRRILEICNEDADEAESPLFKALWAGSQLQRIKNLTEAKLHAMENMGLADETSDDFNIYEEYRII